MEMIDDFDDGFDNEIDLALMERMPWLEAPLDTSEPCIRILKLLKGVYDSTVACSLQVVSLDDDPDYESLSYVWGAPEKTRAITVGGETFSATENLVDFLRCLRLRTADRLLWVDAICVDQQNDKEKNGQLRLMARIYRQAKDSHIWFGYFLPSWSSEIISDSNEYIRASKMAPHQWSEAELIFRHDLRHFLKAGGKPQQKHERFSSESKSCEEILSQTLQILDRVTAGMHLYDFPLFLVAKDVNHDDQFTMNRHWLTIIDCTRWLLSRSWWTRVWTPQEAVLPKVDALIHAHPYSFHISRLLNGIGSIINHRLECCKDLGRLFLGKFQRFPFHQYLRATTLHNHRESFAKVERQWLTLGQAISSTQSRKATDPRDHFFGIIGLLPQIWQDSWFQNYDCSYTAAEIFGQCTKLLYANSDSLEQLSDAIGVKRAIVIELPSWAIDLSNRLPDSEDDSRWDLYDASRQSRYERVRLVSELAGPSLAVKVIQIGTVRICASRVSHDKLDSDKVFSHKSERHRLYKDYADPLGTDRFWRAIFMDRDIWRYWLHKRKPLPLKRLDDIHRWWRSRKESGDC